jgi:hypothetical protein
LTNKTPDRPRARAKTPHVPMPQATVEAIEMSALRTEARAKLEEIMVQCDAPNLRQLVTELEAGLDAFLKSA